MADAKIIDTTKGIKKPSFKSYDVDAQGNTEIESWTPPSRKHGMKRVMERVKRGADGAGILFEYSIDDEDIVTYSEKEYKNLPSAQKEGLVFDDQLKLWYRVECGVYLKFGPFQKKGWKVLARLEPMNDTTEKDRKWRAVKVLPFPGVPDSAIYPYLPKIADEASRCDACQNLRYRTDTYLLVSPKGKHEIVGTTCLQGYTGLDPDTLLALYAALDPTNRYRAGKSASPRNLQVANKDFNQFMLLLSRWVETHGYNKYAPGVTPTKRRSYYGRSYSSGKQLGEFLFQGFLLPKGMDLEVSNVSATKKQKFADEFKAVGKQYKNTGADTYTLKGPLFVSDDKIPYKIADAKNKKVVDLHTEMMQYVKNLTPANSYQVSIKSLFTTGEVTRKVAPLAGSIYQALQNFKNPPPPPPPKPKTSSQGQYYNRPKPTPLASAPPHPTCFGNVGSTGIFTIKITTNRNMTSRAGNNFNLMKGTVVNQGNKQATWFESPGTAISNSAVGSTITVEASVKGHQEYKGVWSTTLSGLTIVPQGTTSSVTYIGAPGGTISERVKILSSKPATYGGKEVRMETPSGKKLIAYDSHSQLQLANVGEVWEITAKVKKHNRGMTQIYYISSATKV
tara:strand:+ start:21429 stop:23288 length:1860 start_codon:yes stop_codon:yes gene_type:complete